MTSRSLNDRRRQSTKRLLVLQPTTVRHNKTQQSEVTLKANSVNDLHANKTTNQLLLISTQTIQHAHTGVYINTCHYEQSSHQANQCSTSCSTTKPSSLQMSLVRLQLKLSMLIVAFVSRFCWMMRNGYTQTLARSLAHAQSEQQMKILNLSTVCVMLVASLLVQQAACEATNKTTTTKLVISLNSTKAPITLKSNNGTTTQSSTTEPSQMTTEAATTPKLHTESSSLAKTVLNEVTPALATSTSPITTTAPLPIPITTITTSTTTTKAPINPVNAAYCSPSLCELFNGTHMLQMPHIACQNDGAFGPHCGAKPHLLFMSERRRNLLLDMHNLARARIAVGQVEGYKSAAHMPVLKWDNELEYLATLHVKRCQFAHDLCRNTKEYPYSGQNIGFYWIGRAFKSHSRRMRSFIVNWFREYRDANQTFIDQYEPHPEGKKIGHFTMLVSDRAHRVGCAAIRFRDPEQIDDMKLLMTCNYDYTNVIGEPIYQSGPTASKCIYKISEKYPALCDWKDAIYDYDSEESVESENIIDNNINI